MTGATGNKINSLQTTATGPTVRTLSMLALASSSNISDRTYNVGNSTYAYSAIGNGIGAIEVGNNGNRTLDNELVAFTTDIENALARSKQRIGGKAGNGSSDAVWNVEWGVVVSAWNVITRKSRWMSVEEIAVIL